MTPAVAEYNTVREASIDLVNDILRGKLRDAIEHQSPHRQLIDEEEYHPGHDPLVQADQLVVDIEEK